MRIQPKTANTVSGKAEPTIREDRQPMQIIVTPTTNPADTIKLEIRPSKRFST